MTSQILSTVGHFPIKTGALAEWNTILLTPVNRWLYDCLFFAVAAQSRDKIRPSYTAADFYGPKSTFVSCWYTNGRTTSSLPQPRRRLAVTAATPVYCFSFLGCFSTTLFSFSLLWQVYILNWEVLAVKLTRQSFLLCSQKRSRYKRLFIIWPIIFWCMSKIFCNWSWFFTTTNYLKQSMIWFLQKGLKRIN